VLAPENAGGDADGFVREFGASAEEGAGTIDHGGERPGCDHAARYWARSSARNVPGRLEWRSERGPTRKLKAEKRTPAAREVERRTSYSCGGLTRTRAEEFAQHEDEGR